MQKISRQKRFRIAIFVGLMKVGMQKDVEP